MIMQKWKNMSSKEQPKKGEMGIIGFRGKGQRYVEFPILTISSFKILKISEGDAMVTFISN